MTEGVTDDQVGDMRCGHCFEPIQTGEPHLVWALPADLLVGLVEWHPRCAITLGRELQADGEERALAHDRWQALQKVNAGVGPSGTLGGFMAPMMPASEVPTSTNPSDPLEQMPRERLWWAVWQVLPAAMHGDVSRATARFLARVRALFRRKEFDVGG